MTTMAERTRRLVSTTPASRALRYLPITAVGVDLAAITAALTLATIGRTQLSVFDDSTYPLDNVFIVGPLTALGWIAMIFVLRGYRENVFGAGTDEFKRILNASLFASALVGVGCYLVKFQLSRSFYGLTFVFGLLALLTGRWALRQALHAARRAGILRQRVLIIGGISHVDEISAILARENWLGYDVIGALTPDVEAETTTGGIPILGCDEELQRFASEDIADVFFFAGGTAGTGDKMRQVMWDLERHHAQMIVAPSVTEIASDRVRVRPVGGLPLMHLSPPSAQAAVSAAKRSFDIVGSAVLIALFLPLFAVIALRIRLHDRGPALFGHNRVGRDGEAFKCLKFRTMVMNAEALLPALIAERGESALLFKMADDPRITKPGKWLRRYSLDELPQLFNVFRGDMSLVGPRPQVAAEVELYDDAMRRRLRVRPGMTGLWQVSGRNDLTADEAMRLDLYYVDNWSIVQDLNILMRTVGAVTASRGAY